MDAETVLVVSDDPRLANTAGRTLMSDGWDVVGARSGECCLEVALRKRPQVIILESGQRGQDAITLCRELRGNGIQAHILLLGCTSEQADHLLGPEVGADDLMEKPARAADLTALIRARLRHLPRPRPVVRQYRFGHVEVDFEALQARRQGREVRLTCTEFQILLRLLSSPGKPVTRIELLNEIWGLDCSPTTRTVDNHILNLRRKLEPDPRRPRYILSVHGVGYRFRG